MGTNLNRHPPCNFRHRLEQRQAAPRAGDSFIGDAGCAGSEQSFRLGRVPSVLAGRSPGLAVDRGAIVCACFDVGLKTIVAAIAERQLADVAAIGAALGAGTNCGSCRPALARLLPNKENAHVA